MQIWAKPPHSLSKTGGALDNGRAQRIGIEDTGNRSRGALRDAHMDQDRFGPEIRQNAARAAAFCHDARGRSRDLSSSRTTRPAQRSLALNGDIVREGSSGRAPTETALSLVQLRASALAHEARTSPPRHGHDERTSQRPTVQCMLARCGGDARPSLRCDFGPHRQRSSFVCRGSCRSCERRSARCENQQQLERFA